MLTALALAPRAFAGPARTRRAFAGLALTGQAVSDPVLVRLELVRRADGVR